MRSLFPRPEAATAQGDGISVSPRAVQLFVLVLGAGLLLAPGIAHAAGVGAGSMPWVGVLQSIEGFLQGTLAKVLATILVIFLGFLIAFGEIKGFLGLFLRVSFGLSLVFFAGTWISMFF